MILSVAVIITSYFDQWMQKGRANEVDKWQCGEIGNFDLSSGKWGVMKLLLCCARVGRKSVVCSVSCPIVGKSKV